MDNPPWLLMTKSPVCLGLNGLNPSLFHNCIKTILCLGCYLPWLLTLSRQGVCCLNSMQDLQNYDLHKWLSSSPSSKVEIGVSKGLSIIDFHKGYKPSGYKIPGLQWMRIKSSSAKSHWVFKLRIYLSTDEVFKSLITKLGWIFVMILNRTAGLWYLCSKGENPIFRIQDFQMFDDCHMLATYRPKSSRVK